MNDFYAVWNVAHGPPTFRHDRFDDAVKEAERLAREHPGQHFYVLGTLGVAHQPAPPSIFTSTPLGILAEIPF